MHQEDPGTHDPVARESATPASDSGEIRRAHPQLADTAEFRSSPLGASPLDTRADTHVDTHEHVTPPPVVATEPGTGARPMASDEARTVQATSAPAGALAGGAAGAAAGLATVTLGPIGLGIGALVGAVAGSLGGWFGGRAATDVPYDDAADAHYRALYEGGIATDRGFDAVRPAYQLGHVAAHNPDWAGRDFTSVEPELRRAWDGELRTRHAVEWEAVRPYARDAYGHARSEGGHRRRDAGVIGSAGSAVDPVELARARAGESSTEYRAAGHVELREPTESTRGLGEQRERDADTAHDPRHENEAF